MTEIADVSLVLGGSIRIQKTLYFPFRTNSFAAKFEILPAELVQIFVGRDFKWPLKSNTQLHNILS